MATRPRLFLYALVAFGGISIISYLWNWLSLPAGLGAGIQMVVFFVLGVLLLALSWRDFQRVRSADEISSRRRGPLLLMTVAAACLGLLALLLALGTLGRINGWSIAGLLAYGLYGFGAIGLGLSILAVSQLLLQQRKGT